MKGFSHALITYTHDHGLAPKMVEPQPNRSCERYLVLDDRDFFAVYRRLSPSARSDHGSLEVTASRNLQKSQAPTSRRGGS